MLRWLRAALTLIVLSLSIFLGVVFATQNTALVPLILGSLELAEQPMAVWLLSFLIVGVVLGSLMSVALMIRQRAISASLKRENARLHQRLNRDVKDG
jgi:uncharacterized integral membrane protein